MQLPAAQIKRFGGSVQKATNGKLLLIIEVADKIVHIVQEKRKEEPPIIDNYKGAENIFSALFFKI